MFGAKFSLAQQQLAAQHQYNNTVRRRHKPVTPAETDGPWPEGAKRDLNQFEWRRQEEWGGGGGGGDALVYNLGLEEGGEGRKECLSVEVPPM